MEWFSEEPATAREDSKQMDACTYVRDQPSAARPPKPGKNECQILIESQVGGVRAVVEIFTGKDFRKHAEAMLKRPMTLDLIHGTLGNKSKETKEASEYLN